MIDPGGTPSDPSLLAAAAESSLAAVAAVTRQQLSERAIATFAAITTFAERLRHERQRLAAQSEELRRQREELRAQREQLREHGSAFRQAGVVPWGRADDRAPFDDVPACYVVTDAAGTIRRANRRMAAVLDAEAGALEGRPLAELVDRSDRAELHHAFARLLASPEVEEWPMRLRPWHGPALEMRTEARAMRDEDGRVKAIHWIFHPVDEGFGDLL